MLEFFCPRKPVLEASSYMEMIWDIFDIIYDDAYISLTNVLNQESFQYLYAL